MARLIYSAIASLDGYVADEQGRFGWAQPRFEGGMVYLRYRALT